MAKKIKVTCNGDKQHVNEFDLDKLLKPVIVMRSAMTKPREIPERSVFHCQFCRAGKVVITREMLEEAAK